MAKKACTDEEFIAIWREHQSPEKVSQAIGLSTRNTLKRRRTIEDTHGIVLDALKPNGMPKIYIPDEQMQANITIDNGTILVGSDCHYNPEYVTTAHRGFVQFVKYLKPKIVILNGD
ncbi:hypothetical protein, partial [Klebsiella pneumoniae]|uniref:hypothetical protein n=1 Tax=Klebsiella pneumoniae TaxID=573 RepID=UPI003A84C454